MYGAVLVLDHPFRVELKFGNMLARVLEDARKKKGIETAGQYQAIARLTWRRRHGGGEGILDSPSNHAGLSVVWDAFRCDDL